LRALPVASLVASIVLLVALVAIRARRMRMRASAPWRVAVTVAPRNGGPVATVVDIAPYLARRELVEGAIAIAALASLDQGASVSHRSAPWREASVVDIASRRRALRTSMPDAPRVAGAPRRSGITVANSTRIQRSDTIEHLA